MEIEQNRKRNKNSDEERWNDSAVSEQVYGWEPSMEDEPDDLSDFDPRRLCTVSGEELLDMRLEPVRFCVDGLLPEGLSILGGAAKAGKSWLVLDLGVRVAKGIPIWEIPTLAGDVLYLSLEDSLNRIQDRLNRVTDDPPSNLFFSITAGTLAGGLCEQIKDFKQTHPELTLVVVDTFQVVRGNNTEISYAGDYVEVRQLKALAEELRISLLLVHHLRKQKDKDPLNMISGTTGIAGAADAVFILNREHRDGFEATLTCTGRDIEQRSIRLRFNRERCVWDCVRDSAGHPENKLPNELESFVGFMREQGSFEGTNTELAEQYNHIAETSISPKVLKQQMNRWRYLLEECGVFFDSRRSNGTRTVSVRYCLKDGSDASDAKDAKNAGATECVTCVTCDPVTAP